LLQEKEVAAEKAPRSAETNPEGTGAGKKEATLDEQIDKPSAALCPEPYRVAKTVPDFMVEQSPAETRGRRAVIAGNGPDNRGEIVQRS
jgi:hypothetical protein